MKLDKIKFAKVVQFIGRCMDDVELAELDDLIDITVEPVQIPGKADPADINELMRLMAGGKERIVAIKIYRQITGCTLKESKDAVEAYWATV